MTSSNRIGLLCAALLVLLTTRLQAADAPKYEECRLDSLFPAGGRAGETVEVDFYGNNGGLADARAILVDGPPGIAIEKVQNIQPAHVRATLHISADARPGRRMLRVQSDRSGLTNMLYFMIGRLPEQLEKEPNNERANAEAISLPRIVNGKVDPAADVDCFSFDAKSGQRLVAAVFAHALDSHGQGKDFGLADASLRIEDPHGRVIAEAQDTLGLDPLVEFTAPSDGKYFACVQLVAFRGFPQAVYRLAVGDVSVATTVFPFQGQRSGSFEAEFVGPLVPPSSRQPLIMPPSQGPVEFVSLESPTATGFELPVLSTSVPPITELEPNDDKTQSTSLGLGVPVSARFVRPDDQDWFRVTAKAGQKLCIETTAQRYLRSPVDTFIQAYDATGKLLGENDDGFSIDYMSIHDYISPDSRLIVTSPADDEIWIRVVDQAANSGDRAIYSLLVDEARPDFALYQFPDAVPIWGPGSTAALIVKVERGPVGFEDDIELTVEDLPPGWIGSSTTSHAKMSNANLFSKHRFLTITAPAQAALGTVVPFRVVGRARIAGNLIERVAQPMTLYYTSDIGFFRITPVSRAVVAKPQGPWLATPVREIQAKVGETIEVPVNVHGLEGEASIALVPNAGMVNVGCGMNPPRTVPVEHGIAKFPVNLSTETMPPGSYDFVVARSWRSDIRIGMPGPCTPLIRVHVSPK